MSICYGSDRLEVLGTFWNFTQRDTISRTYCSASGIVFTLSLTPGDTKSTFGLETCLDSCYISYHAHYTD